MKKEHIGSSFDNFLNEEGILAETERSATKRVIAFQVQQLMLKNNISKSRMARDMKTSRSSIDRLLDPDIDSMTLHTLESAASILGKRLHIELI
jgi:predicted XRE-type DNA-binding protein